MSAKHVVPIAPDETALTLHSKLDQAANTLLSTVLPALRDGIQHDPTR
ncbi:hypothetical protein P4S72_19705 [Vibrio sp. PP-XX7]